MASSSAVAFQLLDLLEGAGGESDLANRPTEGVFRSLRGREKRGKK